MACFISDPITVATSSIKFLVIKVSVFILAIWGLAEFIAFIISILNAAICPFYLI